MENHEEAWLYQVCRGLEHLEETTYSVVEAQKLAKARYQLESLYE